MSRAVTAVMARNVCKVEGGACANDTTSSGGWLYKAKKTMKTAWAATVRVFRGAEEQEQKRAETTEQKVFRMLFNGLSIVAMMLFFVEPSYAGAGAGTFQSVTNGVNTLVTILKAVAIGVGTIAILWTGYKIVFGGATFREMAPILIGGIFVSGASGLAALLFTPD